MQLTPREALERAENDVKIAQSTLVEREKQVRTQEVRLGQDRAQLASAQFDLSKVRIESPIAGIVTRRNIQEGETAVVGTMNNAGTVLLTVADMSVIQAEVEVDETNIPNVSLGQLAKITIDAIPDRTFKGHVTEIGNSPIQATGQAATNQQATNFKVVVVLDEEVPDVRPGFTCTADITTATRKNVVAVPIPAVAVRELIYDAKGQIVKQPRDDKARAPAPQPGRRAVELEPGQTRKETEGVFVIRDGKAEFVPIKIGIAGDRYFEVLSGVKAGDQVITGPYNTVRGMADGDPVRVQPPAATPAGPRRRPRNREQVSRRRGHRAERHLGGQAALADDGARQHRRRHVNHRRRLAHSGAQRIGQARRSSIRPAPIPSSFSSSASCAATKSGCKVQSNPRITLARRRRRPAPQPARVVPSCSSSSRAGASPTATASIDGIRISGVTQEYVNFSNYDAERGRLMSPTEVRRRPAGGRARLRRRPNGCSGRTSIRSTRRSRFEGVHFRVVGVSAKRGTLLGQSQDEFAVIPLGQFQQIFGSRRQLTMSVKPRDLAQIAPAIDDATMALRIARRLKPSQPDNFAHLQLGDGARHLSIGDQRHLRGARRRRRAVAGRRRRRHHEHHADGGDRANARDRLAQGARRAEVRHHDADAHRIGRVVGVRRGRRHDAGRGHRHHHLAAHADSGVDSAVVGGAGHRHHGARRAVLRSVSGVARGADLDPIEALRRGMKTPQIRYGLIREVIVMAFDTVRTNKLRSGLTVLGVVIGITSIVAMTALIRGFDTSLRGSFSTGLGPNTIYHPAVRRHQLRQRTRVLGADEAAES